MKRTALVVASSLLLCSCAAINSRAISYSEHGDRLFVWKANYSAGMASKEGGLCAQGALTAVATSLKGSAKGNSGVPNGPSGELTFGQQQALAMINASNNQTAYANIAFFYLCQIVNNKPALTPEQIVQMWSAANLAITAVNVAGSNPSTSASTSLETTTTTVPTTAAPATSDKGTTSTTTTKTTQPASPAKATPETDKGVSDALKTLGAVTQQLVAPTLTSPPAVAKTDLPPKPSGA